MNDQHRRDALVGHVQRRVRHLQHAYARGAEQPTSYGAATIAGLRRADPLTPGDDPAVWQITLGDLPEALLGHGDEPSREESAVHAALCLYAVHQQSRPDGVHTEGRRLGQAVRALAEHRAVEQELDSSVVNRLHQLGSATTARRRMSVLRSLLTLMRTDRTSATNLDYGLLARDLYDLADPNRAAGVRLVWGRDLRHRPPNDDEGRPASDDGSEHTGQ